MNQSPYIFKNQNEFEIIIIEWNMQINKENENISKLKLYKKEIINYYLLFILINYLIFRIIIVNYNIYYFKYYN